MDAHLLKEMFPQLSLETINSKLQELNEREFDSIVEFFLKYNNELEKPFQRKEEISDIKFKNKYNENFIGKEFNEGETLEMISLEPSVWSNDENERKKLEEEDSKFALHLYEEELQNSTTYFSFPVSPKENKINQNLDNQLKEIRENMHQKWKIKNNKSSQVQQKYNVQDYSLNQQIKEIRKIKHGAWRNTKLAQKKVFTLSDLEEHSKEIEKTHAEWGGSGTHHNSLKNVAVHTINNTFYDPLKIGKQALDFTNEFRNQNKLPPLKWHQSLYDIGVIHSKDMGEKKVPFGHHGFNDRVKKYPFSVRSAAENVAMNSGVSEIARVAVNGWIGSPGHRKNLLSRMTWCGIGVYQNSSGQWYLTQLFGS